jgi:hypothetical protein
MNKLIFLFLSLLSFALHALMGDHKAFVDVKAQTVEAHKLLVDKIGNSLGIRLNRTRLIRLALLVMR